MTQMREKCADELERVVQCREVARCHWRRDKTDNEQVQKARMESLAQFNEVVAALKRALVENSGDLMIRALDLSKRTP